MNDCLVFGELASLMFDSTEYGPLFSSVFYSYEVSQNSKMYQCIMFYYRRKLSKIDSHMNKINTSIR